MIHYSRQLWCVLVVAGCTPAPSVAAPTPTVDVPSALPGHPAENYPDSIMGGYEGLGTPCSERPDHYFAESTHYQCGVDQRWAAAYGAEINRPSKTPSHGGAVPFKSGWLVRHWTLTGGMLWAWWMGPCKTPRCDDGPGAGLSHFFVGALELMKPADALELQRRLGMPARPLRDAAAWERALLETPGRKPDELRAAPHNPARMEPCRRLQTETTGHRVTAKGVDTVAGRTWVLR